MFPLFFAFILPWHMCAVPMFLSREAFVCCFIRKEVLLLLFPFAHGSPSGATEDLQGKKEKKKKVGISFDATILVTTGFCLVFVLSFCSCLLDEVLPLLPVHHKSASSLRNARLLIDFDSFPSTFPLPFLFLQLLYLPVAATANQYCIV